MPPSAPRRVLCLVAVLLSLVAAARLTRGAAVAGAAVEHGSGYSGTVLGFTGWYGSYHLGVAGMAWCIDHGSHAPDEAFGYAPTAVDDASPATRRALAWAVGAHGPGADVETSAALMLVAHDLMGASYPHGQLDVDALSPRELAGFADAPDVILRARVIKADALGHAAFVPPLGLTLDMPSASDGDAATAVARVTDREGRPVPGVAIAVVPTGPTLTGPAWAVTSTDGAATFAYTAALGENRLNASAVVPDLTLHALSSTSRPAQRVAVPASVTIEAVNGYEVLAPTTSSTTTSTSTTSSTTTTTAPTTTSTTSTTSTTVLAATAAPTTTTSVPATTTSAAPVAVPPTTAASQAAPAAALPRTGGRSAALASTGFGLVLLGAAVRSAGRRRVNGS